MFLWEQTLSTPHSVWILGPTQVSQKRWAGVSLGAKWPWVYGSWRDPGPDAQNQQHRGPCGPRGTLGGAHGLALETKPRSGGCQELPEGSAMSNFEIQKLEPVFS